MIIIDWSKQSDVCIVLSNVGISTKGHAWYCLGCKFENHRTSSTKKMLEHVKHHRDCKNTIPADVEIRIKAAALAHLEEKGERKDTTVGDDVHRSKDLENLKRLAEESEARHSVRVHKEPHHYTDRLSPLRRK